MEGRMSWLCNTFPGDQAGGTKEAEALWLPPDRLGIAMVCGPAVVSVREDSAPGA